MQNFDLLFLHQEIVLLALHNDKGTLASGFSEYSVAGAVLAELLLENNISIDEKQKQLVSVVNSNYVGDPIIKECLNKINSSKRRASLDTWISRLADTKNLMNSVLQQLCERKIVHIEEDKIFFIFKQKIYPEINPLPEEKMVERLRTAIFTDKEVTDPRTVILVSLADSADLLEDVFGRKELKPRKQRIKEIISGEATGEKLTEIIQAIHICQQMMFASAAMVCITNT